MSDGELGELVELGRAVVLERVFVRGGGLVRAEWEGCGRERGWERERVDDGDGYGGGWVVFEIGVERERGRRGGAAAAAAAADGDGYKDAGQTQLRVSGSTEDENGNYVDEEGSEVDDVLSEGSLEVPFILDW